MALIQTNYASHCLKRTVNFNAVIPIDNPFSNTESILPLKTLYLLHGLSASCNNWLQSESVGDFASKYNIAIFMPDAENHFYVDDVQRGDMYGDFLGRELINYTRRMFPISNKREDTIIGGFSMGGYGALRNGLKYNDSFGYIIAISSALLTGNLLNAPESAPTMWQSRGYFESVFGDLNDANTRDVDVFWLSAQLKNSVLPDIYIACGINDALIAENRKLHEHLTNLEIPHVFEEEPGTHDSEFLKTHLIRALDRLPLNRSPEVPNPLWID